MSKILINNYAIYYYLQAEKKTYTFNMIMNKILKQLLSFKIVLKYSHAKTKFDTKSYKAQHFSAL